MTGELIHPEGQLEEFTGAGALGPLIFATSFDGAVVPPRVWHVPDLMPAKTVTLLSGDGGTGKSTLALQLAVASVIGKPWLGRRPRQGPVLYLSAEDDRDELHRRIHDASLFYDVEIAAMTNLNLWVLADEDAALVIEGRERAVKPTDRWEQFAGLADEISPALIVLDSLADVFAGNENDRGQARQFIAMLRRIAIQTGAAVLVLAHPSLSGLTTGSGTSGSTAWNNSVRSRLYFRKPAVDDLDTDPDVRVLSLKKSNYARALPDMRLRRRIGGYAVEGGADGGTVDMAAAQQRADRLFLELLAIYEAQGRPVSHQPSATYAPAVFAKDALAQGHTKAGLQAAMNRLFAGGEIAVRAHGPPSKQRTRIVKAAREG